MPPAGLQEAFRDAKGKVYYELTAEGEEHGVAMDTSKAHADGTPVRQIKWKSSVAEYLRDRTKEHAA